MARWQEGSTSKALPERTRRMEIWRRSWPRDAQGGRAGMKKLADRGPRPLRVPGLVQVTISAKSEEQK